MTSGLCLMLAAEVQSPTTKEVKFSPLLPVDEHLKDLISTILGEQLGLHSAHLSFQAS